MRTLHHYDRVGLLRPARNSAGYRRYSERDFARLQQVVTLKFIGLSLGEIRDFLASRSGSRSGRNPAEALRVQRRMLEHKRDQLNAAIAALLRAERMLPDRGEPSGELFCKILEVIAMHNNTEWGKIQAKYFTEEQRAEMARRADPQLAAEGTRKWNELIAEVEAAVQRGEDPAGPHARELAQRWNALVQEFVNWASGPGSKLNQNEVKSGLSKMWADRQNWPAGMKPPFSEAALAFIREAQRKKS